MIHYPKLYFSFLYILCSFIYFYLLLVGTALFRKKDDDDEDKDSKSRECYYSPKSIKKVLLVHPSSKIRFQPHNLNHFWKLREAWSKASINLALYRITERSVIDRLSLYRMSTEGALLVNGTYSINPDCQYEVGNN